MIAPTKCPDCGGPVVEYVLVLACANKTECGWYYVAESLKRRRTQADAERRQAWQYFTMNEPGKYVEFQRDAMYTHLHKTPALDTVHVSAHDAFGNPEGSWTYKR